MLLGKLRDDQSSIQRQLLYDFAHVVANMWYVDGDIVDHIKNSTNSGGHMLL